MKLPRPRWRRKEKPPAEPSNPQKEAARASGWMFFWGAFATWHIAWLAVMSLIGFASIYTWMVALIAAPLGMMMWWGHALVRKFYRQVGQYLPCDSVQISNVTMLSAAFEGDMLTIDLVGGRAHRMWPTLIGRFFRYRRGGHAMSHYSLRIDDEDVRRDLALALHSVVDSQAPLNVSILELPTPPITAVMPKLRVPRWLRRKRGDVGIEETDVPPVMVNIVGAGADITFGSMPMPGEDDAA